MDQDAPDVVGRQGWVRDRVDEIEGLRRRVFQEAEESFARQARALQMESQVNDAGSFQTASSGDTRHEGGSQAGRWVWQPEDVGIQVEAPPLPPPPPPPPPPENPSMGHGSAKAGPSISESLRQLELPSLAPPGGEGSALAFGDWLTVVTPLMLDVSGSAKEWWMGALTSAEETYSMWLRSTPINRLRLKPQVTLAKEHERIEQRGVSMLLAAICEPLRRDLIADRALSTTGILYKLLTTYQPGGSAERALLLKQLTEAKPGSNAPEILASLRLRRRWMSRSIELQVTLPDPMVLAGVLSRYAEALGRVGGGQITYRVSTVRQELGMDLRPTMGAIRDMSEYLQAEAEELNLSLPTKGHATSALLTGTGPQSGSEGSECAEWSTSASSRPTYGETYSQFLEWAGGGLQVLGHRSGMSTR